VRDLKKIFIAHLKGRFLLDLVTAFPFSKILKPMLSSHTYRILYILKIFRLEKAFLIFSTKSFQKHLKSF